jgi:hypothetical protein
VLSLPTLHWWLQKQGKSGFMACCLRPQKAAPASGEDYEMVHKPVEGGSATNGEPSKLDEETIEQFKLLLKNSLSGGAM